MHIVAKAHNKRVKKKNNMNLPLSLLDQYIPRALRGNEFDERAGLPFPDMPL
jgi:hypothetical protein